MKTFLILLFLFPLSLLSMYEDKLVDDFEKGHPPNKVGGEYLVQGKGISFRYTHLYAREGRWALMVNINVPPKEEGRFICELNGLDMSKAEYLILSLGYRGNDQRITVLLKDKEGRKKGVKVRLTPGKWEEIKLPLSYFSSLNLNLLDSLQFIFPGGMRGRLILEKIRFSGPPHIFFLSLKDNLYGFPERLKGEISPDMEEKKFLNRILMDTLKHFLYLVDRRTHLPVDWIELSPLYEYRIGDYTSPTNIGLYIMALVLAGKEGWMKEETVLKRLEGLLDTLSRLPRWKGFWLNWYSTTNLQVTSPYVSTVDNGWLAAGFIVLRQAYPEKFGERVSKWLREMDFSELYDPVEGKLYLGYDLKKREFSPYHYGLIATEARLASLIAIGKGDLPPEHWFRIYRTLPRAWKWQRQEPQGLLINYLGIDVFEGYYQFQGMEIVPSWGGSSFEFLMPTLVVKEKELGRKALGLNNLRALKSQILYARKKGYPVWGFSPSAIPGKEGYGEFGIPEIGSKGYPEKGIVTPYASILGIEYLPREVIENMRNLIKNFPLIYGEYGFYDSVDIKNKITSTRYLTLDQAMIFLSLGNFMTRGKLREWFHKDPVGKNIEKLLQIESFYPKRRKIRIREKFILADFDNLERVNRVGGKFGAWDLYPEDPTQIALDSFVKDR